MYRYAWECSTPLSVALRSQPSFLSQHVELTSSHVSAERALQMHQDALASLSSSLAPTLHVALRDALQGLCSLGSAAEIVHAEPVHVQVLPTGQGAGPTWRIGVGAGADIRQITINRLQRAMDELVRNNNTHTKVSI